MSKIRLDSGFLDLDDKPTVDEKTGKPHTLYAVLRNAVAAELKEDTAKEGTASIENRIKNFDIFLDLKKAGEKGEIELTAEQIAYLKERVARLFTTLISGPTLKYLEGKNPYSEDIQIGKTDTAPASSPANS